MKLLINLHQIIISIKSYMNEFEKIISELSVGLPELEKNIKHKIVKAHIYEIMICLQKGDIFNQEINHIYKTLNKNTKLFKIENIKKNPDVTTVIVFLMTITEKQMIRISNNVNSMINEIETELRNIINNLKFSDNKSTMIVESFINSLTNFKSKHNNISCEIIELSTMRKKTEYKSNLKRCIYRETIIEDILNNLTVNDERETILKEFPEIKLEKTVGKNITLF